MVGSGLVYLPLVFPSIYGTGPLSFALAWVCVTAGIAVVRQSWNWQTFLGFGLVWAGIILVYLFRSSPMPTIGYVALCVLAFNVSGLDLARGKWNWTGQMYIVLGLVGFAFLIAFGAKAFFAPFLFLSLMWWHISASAKKARSRKDWLPDR